MPVTPDQHRLRLCVLVSGRGSNLRALAEAIDDGRCAACIVCVVADREDAAALRFAQERGVKTAVVRPKQFAERTAWDVALRDAMLAAAPDLVVSAGFMRLLGSAVLDAFKHRIVNVHPSLLPAFPGVDAPAQAVQKGVTLSGCTVHLVDAGIDTGPILAQAAVPVLPTDDAAALHARIQVAEHALLPAVVAAIANGAIALDPKPRFVAHEGDRDGAVQDVFSWPRLVSLARRPARVDNP
jgi:phosphoribosylglycinamide formyltransferase-1